MTNAWINSWIPSGVIGNNEWIANLNNTQITNFVDLMIENGEWNLNYLQRFMPNNIVEEILAIHPPRAYNGKDACQWKGSRDVIIIFIDVYHLLTNSNSSDNDHEVAWKIIWNLKTPERIRAFIWQVNHDTLITNFRLSRMNIRDLFYRDCMKEIETVIHAIQDCVVAKTNLDLVY